MLSSNASLLCLALCLVSNAYAWSDAFNARAKTGAQRITDIGNAGADTNRACTLNRWFTSRATKGKPKPGLRRLITNNELAISTTDSNLNPVSVTYGDGDPAVRPEGDAVKARFDCTYDPTDGAIVYSDIFSSTTFTSTTTDYMSCADATWALYQAAKNELDGVTPPATTDYSNIRYLIHTHVISDDAENIFTEMWEAQPEDQRSVMTFTDQNSEQFKAIMGLDNGAVTSGLLRFHNQSMGRKRIKSANVYLNQDQWDIWWELE